MQSDTQTISEFLSRLITTDQVTAVLGIAKAPEKPRLLLRWEKQRTSSWTLKKKIEMIDTVTRDWSCAPVYLIPRMKAGVLYIECVFDGAHKIESLIEFMNDAFSIKEIKDSSWKTSPLRDHVGRTFTQLPADIQTKIQNYTFSINRVSEEVANDPEQLRTLWQRLNNAGTALNGFELDIPIFGTLYKILKNHIETWYGTLVFPGKESIRGSAETVLMQFLALMWFDPYSSDKRARSFTSLIGLLDLWKAAISAGGGVDEIEDAITKNQDGYIGALTKIRSIYTDLSTRHVFPTEDDAKKEWKVPTLILLGRLGRVFTDISHYNHHANKVEPILKTLYATDIDVLIKTLGCKNRNATFQKKFLQYVDTLLAPFMEIVPRAFKVKQAKKAKAVQKNICPECKEPIFPTDRVERDHVIPYSQGGATTQENLEVVHKHCHDARTARMNG
jgi:hypothetical protein